MNVRRTIVIAPALRLFSSSYVDKTLTLLFRHIIDIFFLNLVAAGERYCLLTTLVQSLMWLFRTLHFEHPRVLSRFYLKSFTYCMAVSVSFTHSTEIDLYFFILFQCVTLLSMTHPGICGHRDTLFSIQRM